MAPRADHQMVRKQALRHTRYVLVNRLATPLGALAVLIIIARHSDTLLGEYALVMTFYYIMQMLPLLGLTPYLAREVARHPEMAGKYFSSIGLISILGCVVMDVLVFLFLHFGDYAPQVRQAIAVTGVLIFPGILLFIAEVIFMSLGRAGPAAGIAVAENLARVVVSVTALQMGGGLVELIWIFFATRLAAFAAYLLRMRGTGIISHFELPDRAVLGDIFRVLPAFLVGAVLFVVFSRMDFLVLSIYERVEAIGYYAVGYRPYEISIILLTALIMALFPWISRRFVAARIHFRVAVRGLLLLFVGGLAYAALVGILLADTYVYLLFRNQHPHPVLLTQLFMAALVVAGMDYVTSSLLHASDRQAADTRAMAVGGVFNLVLLFWLVPLYGIYGALLAKLGATCVQCVQKLDSIDKSIGPLWRQGDSWRLILVVAAPLAVALATLGAPLPIRIPVIVAAAIAVPGSMLALGLFQPLRLTRFYWRSRGAGDVRTLMDLVDVVVADQRRRSRMERRASASRRAPLRGIDRASAGVLLARVARHLMLRGVPAGAWCVARLNRHAFGVWVDPASAIGPGWAAFGDAPLRLNARVGAGLVCLGGAEIGPVPGSPSATIVGDAVTLLAGATTGNTACIASGSVVGGGESSYPDTGSASRPRP